MFPWLIVINFPSTRDQFNANNFNPWELNSEMLLKMLDLSRELEYVKQYKMFY